ncbi:hypothetical protein [Oscillatoria sp. FACHB-1406]|uniref:hypothetical protein n=1 Tax=Oscillatoria sp. FACHB-1406 TaxID=2692846 RepID=UPI001682EE3F|nr:hypothetical protein [Oscillatoria sp. FACHB-1406]MBD2578161.1 hypothetical protein [Oscillatoria sp. FACHB-1406]
MNRPLNKFVLFSLLLSVILAPFAGLAPLMICFLVLGSLWFFGSIFQTLFWGDKATLAEESSSDILEK